MVNLVATLVMLYHESSKLQDDKRDNARLQNLYIDARQEDDNKNDYACYLSYREVLISISLNII